MLEADVDDDLRALVRSGAVKVAKDRVVTVAAEGAAALAHDRYAMYYAECLQAPTTWFRVNQAGYVMHPYDVRTCISSNLDAPPLDQELYSRLFAGEDAPGRFFWSGPYGGAMMASAAEGGPCSMYPEARSLMTSTLDDVIWLGALTENLHLSCQLRAGAHPLTEDPRCDLRGLVDRAITRGALLGRAHGVSVDGARPDEPVCVRVTCLSG